MAWTNLPATNATDWSQVDFLQQFVEALRERFESINYRLLQSNHTWSFYDEELLVDFTEGQDVSSVSRLRSLQNSALQLARAAVDPSKYPTAEFFTTSPTSPVPFPIVASTVMRSDAEIFSGVSGGSHFTRKRPLEISSLTGGSYTNGDRARYVKSSGFGGGTTGNSLIYDRVAGAWVVSEDQATPPTLHTFYGLITAGDYIGPWIWNELQQVIQEADTHHVIWELDYPSYAGIGVGLELTDSIAQRGNGYSSPVGYGATAAAAVANAVANVSWTATTSASLNAEAGTLVTVRHQPGHASGDYKADARGRFGRFEYTWRQDSTPRTLADAKLYMFVFTEGAFYNYAPNGPCDFEEHGTGVVEGMNEVYSGGPNAGDTVTFPTIDDPLTVFPAAPTPTVDFVDVSSNWLGFDSMWPIGWVRFEYSEYP